MAKLNPEEFAEKQARNLKNSVPDIERGINAVTVAPTEKAAAAVEKMKTNYLKAIDSGKVARRLKGVTLEAWKKAAIEKGINRIAMGIDGAHDKVVNFASQLLPYQDKLLQTVGAMPDTSLEDSINRMVAWTRGMSKFSVK
jgi:hypothetical protein